MIRIENSKGSVFEVYGVIKTNGVVPAYATLQKKRTKKNVGAASSFERVLGLGDTILYKDESMVPNEEGYYDGFMWTYFSATHNPMDRVVLDTNIATTRFMKQDIACD
ncbi:hypothetical protein_gp263 [Bacillus phage vB_BceM_WH1]|nr:hypothetical protein_gp263 [Bacillus phage vB_BceM_WH1]